MHRLSELCSFFFEGTFISLTLRIAGLPPLACKRNSNINRCGHDWFCHLHRKENTLCNQHDLAPGSSHTSSVTWETEQSFVENMTTIPSALKALAKESPPEEADTTNLTFQTVRKQAQQQQTFPSLSYTLLLPKSHQLSNSTQSLLEL